MVINQESRQAIALGALATYWGGLEAGYILGNRKRHPKIEGWKKFIFREGHFAFADEWGDEGGRTLITCRGVLVWCMRYAGAYPKEAIPCLKAALGASLQARDEFNGCRGPREYRQPGFTYENTWQGDFSCFRGEERIWAARGLGSYSKIGSHTYWGGMLI